MFLFISLDETKKLLLETEQQLQVLEDLVKDEHLNNEFKDYEKKLNSLQGNKFSELEKLKGRIKTNSKSYLKSKPTNQPTILF